MNNYFLRNTCIFCDNKLVEEYLKNDMLIPIASYCTDSNTDIDIKDIFIPYNIYMCPECKTSQIKYLGNLDIVYKYNHADSTGDIMKNLHIEVLNIINKHISLIGNITEIGSSKGILSELILNKIKSIDKYYIIEPCFIGNKIDKQIILHDYFENINTEQYSDSNTIIISHVFEHFYDPKKILEIIKNNNNINNILLVFPDLEHYKDNNTYHLLNTEHTFYIDNKFVEILFNNFLFEIIEKKYYKNHSVIYLFKRNNNLEKIKLLNNNYKIDNYFGNLLNKKQEIINFIEYNKKYKRNICIFPCSIFAIFLLFCLLFRWILPQGWRRGCRRGGLLMEVRAWWRMVEASRPMT
jgi:hypothetical protein